MSSINRQPFPATPGFGCTIFILGQRSRDLLLEPLPRRPIAMPQQHRLRPHPPHKFQQLLAICMGRQVKLLHVAVPRHPPRARAEHKRLTRLRRLQPSRRRILVRIPHKETALLLITRHPLRQIMRRRIFTHHPRRDHKNLPARSTSYSQPAPSPAPSTPAPHSTATPHAIGSPDAPRYHKSP